MTDLFSNIIYPFLNNSLVLNKLSSLEFDTLIVQYYPIKPFTIIDKTGIIEIDNLFLIYLLLAATYQINRALSSAKQVKVQNTEIQISDLKNHIISNISDNTVLLTFDSMPISNESNIKFQNVFTDIEFNDIQENINHIFLKAKNEIEANMKYLFDDFQKINFNFNLKSSNCSNYIFVLLNYFLNLSKV